MSFAVSSPPSQEGSPPDPFLLAADLFDPPETEHSGDFAECKASSAAFIERHCTIEEPDGTVLPFRLWDFQRDTLHDLETEQAIIVLKARRLGLSWVVLAFALWLAIFNQGIRILVLCKTGDDASELLDRIRRMRDRISNDPLSAHVLANLEQPAKTRDAVTTLDIGASTIRALMGTPAAARSETAGFVILDEFAFQRAAPEIWTAILPTIEGGGKLAMVSTGNGAETSGSTGAEFAALWSRAKSGANNLKALFFPWMARPDRDQAWKERTLANLGDPDRFRKEYPETEQDAFTQPDTVFTFDHAAIDAAERLGAQYDALLTAGTMPAPIGNQMAAGVDWGDFRSHAIPVWELERGGIYIPPGEVATSQADVEDISKAILDSVCRYDFWFGEERYDASFKQSNRTFARTAENLLGKHNAIHKTGRPNTIPVAFGTYKSLCVGYLRMLLRRTGAGETTRVLAISPQNTVLLRQLRGLEQNPLSGKIEKGDDDSVDSLIAGVQPVAKRFRALIDNDQT